MSTLKYSIIDSFLLIWTKSPTGHLGKMSADDCFELKFDRLKWILPLKKILDSSSHTLYSIHSWIFTFEL